MNRYSREKNIGRLMLSKVVREKDKMSKRRQHQLKGGCSKILI